ncbi:MAG: Mur ligase family protein, partial [Casimicrobiaceae bacterium]
MMRYEGRNAVVLGLGLTGLTLARYLARHGARVRVADTRAEPPNAAALSAALPQVPLETGPFSASTFAGADLIAISPGVAKDQPAIAEAVAHGADLAGDIELFARALPPTQKVLAITGTNGKTTVTALTGALVQAAGLSTVVAGNIGDPVLDALERHENGAPWPSVYVLELSSYQIDLTHSLDCDVAALLNITPDHLDRYENFAGYVASKARLFAMQSADHHAVFGIGDDQTATIAGMQVNRHEPGRVHFAEGRGLADLQKDWPSLQGPHN